MGIIRAVPELERVVGERPLPVMMKSIDRLDPHCLALLAHSPAAVLGYVDAEGRQRAGLVGGTPGFAEAESTSRLRLPAPPSAAPGTGAALLVLVPGWRETLRINGTLAEDGLLVEEAFLHCGKAVIRSNLWGPAAAPGDAVEEGSVLGPAAADFLAAAPFAVIASRDGAGRADVSPKGDPPGAARMIGPATAVLADRPGNRRTDTFHNVVERPEVAVLAVVPGDLRTLEITGKAAVSTDAGLRESTAERNRTPKAVLKVDVETVRLAQNSALRDSGLWDPARHVDPADLPRPSTVWTDHLKLNETAGAAAKLVRDGVDERLLRAGLDEDYRQNL
ncbi:pyridoxamine 5'-phosphate oxidase family protein [Amycolatopsis sp. FU40]|uniref:pyridoxamine 5'-phosphate oxidase family protein n=1 Tax=Amycolatopsis sp. FU40 TaxID=2914159 RepID=UPI001F452714|nr:pyridoxamine 5'-phosphate oxidase family protein [Amycolatopsis sp. FU40]UKD57867.1 pyridoxamine 5'-phosphate oxidase family protein [Amycolatopsis sp. FU40]